MKLYILRQYFHALGIAIIAGCLVLLLDLQIPLLASYDDSASSFQTEQVESKSRHEHHITSRILYVVHQVPHDAAICRFCDFWMIRNAASWSTHDSQISIQENLSRQRRFVIASRHVQINLISHQQGQSEDDDHIFMG